MKKIIIYTRVSTDDKAQDPEVQVLKCKQYCELHNHKVIDIIREEGVSGDSYIFDRPNGKKILPMIKQGKIEGIVVFSQDRYSRESPVKFLQQLNYLKDMGITFISVTEPIFNMEGEFSEPLKYFLSWF